MDPRASSGRGGVAGRSGPPGGRRMVGQDAIGVDGFGDILDLHFTQILVVEVQPVLDLIENRAGGADAAGLGHRLEPGRHVDPVAVQVVSVDDHVGKIDAHAEQHPAICRKFGVAPRQVLLHLDGACDGLGDAGELDEQAIPGGAHDAAMVFARRGIDQLLAVRLEGGECPGLVSAHQAGIVRHVGTQDGGESACSRLFDHVAFKPNAKREISAAWRSRR